MVYRAHFWIACLALIARVGPALADDGGPWRLTALASIGSVEDAGYGAKGTFGAGLELGDVFSIELQGGMGVTEEIDLGTERFYAVPFTLGKNS